MKANKSYSSISRAKKREKLMALIQRRKNGERVRIKKQDDPNSNSSTKRKKLSSHFYKKFFRISGQKLKAWKDVNDIITDESCLGSRHKKQRLCSEQGSGEIFLRSCTENKTSSGNVKLADFEEYWVPVHLSSMQIKQYCSILSSNLEALSSSLKNASLHDIMIVITQIQKCCDHPYLVNPALRDSLQTTSLIDSLDAQIGVSGKMQLLDKLLLEIKRCGLRALVLFQSAVNSEKISTGHILDDLVDQRFGEDSYVYIPGKILSNSEHAKKRESLNTFNSEGSERFICLFDYHACHPSIRLSRVDVVILFNSDVNPLNDIKALKRITFDSHSERLTVFRLYSAFTIEEKALFLAKKRITDNRSSVCHRLLAWDASYLFNKVQTCTYNGPMSFSDDVVHELSSMLSDTRVKTGPTTCSMVSNAQMQNGDYSDSIMLFGETENHTKERSIDEYLVDHTPSVFWRKLVKESQHRLEKSCGRLTRRVPKSTQSWFEGENQNYAVDFFFVRTKARSKRKRRKQTGKCRLYGTQQDETQRESLSLNVTDVQVPILPSASISDSNALTPRTNGGQQSQSDQDLHTSSSTPLGTEVIRIEKEFEQITKLHQDKKSLLLSECAKEISEVRKKYDALINDSEVSFAKEIKILEDYQKLVDTNKLLAEILAQNWHQNLDLNVSELNLIQTKLNPKRKRNANRKQKVTRSFNIPNISASTLARPKNPCLTMGPTTYLHGHSLAGPALRAPPPHLRSNPSTFASLHNPHIIGRPLLEPMHNPSIIGIPILESVFSLATAHHDPLVKFDRLYDDAAGPSFGSLGSKLGTF